MTDSLDKKLTITEIFHSIQGESYLAGLPCVFIRLTGCHQRCTYCDTDFAFYGGEKKTLSEIMKTVEDFGCKNVLITGGEPLLQGNVGALAELLLSQGYSVAIETSGALPVTRVPRAVIKIMDLKTPGSGEEHRNDYTNIESLEAKDEIKFVVTGGADLDWALEQIRSRSLCKRCHVSISPTNKHLLGNCADAILNSGQQIRLQTQFHKLIWPGVDRGV